jgi:hypothetical protein
MKENNILSNCVKPFFRCNMIERATIVFVLILIMFIAIWTRAFIGSKKNFAEGEEYFNDRQYIKAITFFDRSMHWYTPFNPYIERSAEYLWEISEQAEQINDERLSLIAIETIRNSFYSSRSFYSPGIHWIDKCESKIRNIVKNQKEMILQRSDADVVDIEYESTMKYNDPNIFWTIILEFGLFGWIVSVLCFIFVFLGAENKSNGSIRSYWFWILLAGINYSLWILGIIKT